MDPTLPLPFPPPPSATPSFPDPTAIPAVVPAATEAQNHLAHAANPTLNPNLPPAANPAPQLNHSHPPYAEMIYAAIAALNERNGSSKRAIAKYIEQAYSGLPPSHSALLTHNLKRLKNTGHLVMVKKSYKLPRSDASPSAPPAPSLSGDPKGQGRGRGRPPKPKIAPGPIIEPNAQPVLVALGLVDDPNVQPVEAKRGPGRPRKTGPVGQDGGPTKRGRGRPPGPRVGVKPRLMKKTPKPKSVTSVLGSNGLKRGRGRPPKSQLKTMVIPFAPNNVPAVAPVVNVPRPRGRPKKDAAAPVLPVYAADGVVGKFPGGPPNVGKARKPKKTTGRPVGRPKKNAAPFALSAVPDAQPIAYVDLKRKLEYIQSKVSEAVAVLKHQITNESAVVAIQELEGLAAMDIISAPLQVETQQPEQLPPPQQLQQLLHPPELPQPQLPQPQLPQWLPHQQELLQPHPPFAP
ncbi:histone H1-like [Carya illinoinensis]|uniref:H15 domain-containing protein n=1 Tax=Carya illinoinensis TaxID=32201 RepID=A0A8T1N8L8_CARIL|nr:histone H1-like [Carya illinoinensis]KAG6625377.1 hypothetical protein CIPAW_16G091800 [Carya illinoinensis]